MHINLHQLRFFYIVSSAGSIRQAAEELYVTPAAVTLQVRNLENFLGYSLFHNKKGRVTLTREGEQIYGFAVTIFNHVENLEAHLEALKTQRSNELILGSHHSTSQFFLPAILEHVQNIYPELDIKLSFLDKRQKLYDEILEQRMHAAIIVGEALNPQIACKTIFESRLVMVAAADGPLAKKTKINADELSQIPLALPQAGTGMHAAIMEFIQKHCANLGMIKKGLNSNIDMLKITLRQHKDVASFAALFSVEHELSEGSLHEIQVSEGLPFVGANIAFMREAKACPALQKFLNALESFQREE